MQNAPTFQDQIIAYGQKAISNPQVKQMLDYQDQAQAQMQQQQALRQQAMQIANQYAPGIAPYMQGLFSQTQPQYQQPPLQQAQTDMPAQQPQTQTGFGMVDSILTEFRQQFTVILEKLDAVSARIETMEAKKKKGPGRPANDAEPADE